MHSSKKPLIDIRSDFVSRPTPEMIEAMVRAAEKPGGFGLRENPIVRELEALAAQKLGKTDSLFVPTCMMAYQIAINVYCRPGQTFVTEKSAHVITSEAAAASALTGAMPIQISSISGALDINSLATLLNPPNPDQSLPSMVLEENTHVRSGGRVISFEHMKKVREIAAAKGVPVHLDGARVFNAAISLSRSSQEIGQLTDSVSFNLNKGLGAPMGAILAGSSKFIRDAERVQQMFGGGWRPAGILAAAGIIALRTMTTRLREDHIKAQLLAKKLAKIDGVCVDENAAETNIVLVKPSNISPISMANKLSDKNILVLPFGQYIRLVIHHEITYDAIDVITDGIYTVLNGDNHDS